MGKKRILYSFAAVIILVIIAFGVMQTNQLTDTQATLANTQNELAVTQSELSDTEAALTSTEADLSLVLTELSTTETSLSSNLTELDFLYLKLDQNFNYLAQMEAEYEAASASLADEKALATTLQNNIDNLQINIGFLTTGYGYLMRNPTYQACKAFIAADQTDKREYVDGGYEAVHFAMDVKTNAIRQKIRCGYVSVRVAGGSLQFILIAFETTDRGIIYILPTTDEEVNLQVGRHFWTQCVIPNSGDYTNPTTYDDIVARFNTTW